MAAEFRNTCDHGDYDTPAATVASMASETYNCQGKQRCIENGTDTGPDCAWERRLCVTCRRANSVTKIRVQTNNLPDHCMSSISVKPQNFDFEVNFNTVATYDAWENDFTTQYQLNNGVCPIQTDFDINRLQIVEYGSEESAHAAGFAVNGVAFQFANQLREDPVYPQTEDNEQPLDTCLGHNQLSSDSGMYHYHHLSPCINATFGSVDSAGLHECDETPACTADKTGYALSGYASMTTRAIVGLAKDGHVMYGPYNDTGALWEPAVVDACGGSWSSDKTEYFYVGQRWHPYLVGCQGPANYPQNAASPLYATCSTNGMVSKLSHFVGVSLIF